MTRWQDDAVGEFGDAEFILHLLDKALLKQADISV
jgi:hypothetical protein